MQRSLTAPLILAAVLAAAAAGWGIFASTEKQRAEQVHAIKTSRSELHLAMSAEHDRGPLAREEWRMDDIDGLSSAVYSATDRHGKTVRVDAKMETYDVSFLFGKAVQDGVWELITRPPRGDRSTRYHIYVAQTANGLSGKRDYSFTDPHYWATTAGHQFHITLDKNKPVPDLLKLKSETLAEPRYQKLVNEIEEFGSPKFRATVAKARAELHVPS